MKLMLSKVIGWLIQQKTIESSDRELYEYALYSFLVSNIPLVFLVIASILLGKLLEGMLIVLPFMIIRKFCGGYHAKHVYTCFILSTGLVLSGFYIVNYLNCNYFIMMVISGVSIMFNSPIDSQNKRLDKSEIKLYKRITEMLIVSIIVLYIILFIIKCSYYAKYLAMSITLIAILQVPCIVKNRMLVFEQNKQKNVVSCKKY